MKQLFAGMIIGGALVAGTGLLMGAGPEVEKAEAPIGRFQMASDGRGVWVIDTANGYVSCRSRDTEWVGLGTPVPEAK